MRSSKEPGLAGRARAARGTGRLRRLGPLRGASVVLLRASSLRLLRCSRSTPPATATAPAVDPGAALNHDLSAIFTTGPASGALWGVRVESLDRPGAPLFAINPDHLFVPASNMKLLTVAAAATRLGWDYTFETTVRATTPARI